MSNAIVTFEVEGVKHSLYFGIIATEIIGDKSGNSVKATGEVDALKGFAYVIFGGLCNDADSKDKERPRFPDAYMLAESIMGDDDLTGRIYAAWMDSKPYAELTKKLALLTGDKKKEVAEEKTPEKIGPQ